MDVTVLGRIGYDLYAEQPGVPLKGVRSFSRYLGGSSANAAVGLSRLGLDVAIISCLGTDALSDYLLEYLEAESVDTSLVQRRAGVLPSLCLTEVSPPDSFPQVFYREKAADTMLEVSGPEKASICRARLFLTNGTSLCASPSRESTLLALEWAKQAGVRTVLDVDYRAMSWRSAAEAGLYARLALPNVDILIANPEEILLVTESVDLNAAILRLRAWRVPLVVAKLGPKGTMVSDGETLLSLPPYPAKVASTIGAGDGFAAGFLFGVVTGLDLGESLKYGNATAALVVSRTMCSEAMPTANEVVSLIEQHPEILPTPPHNFLCES